MGFWAAASQTYRLARDLDEARDAAAAVLDAGGSPMAALKVFAAHSDTQLDDAAVAALEDGLRRAIAAGEVVVAAAAWVAMHEPAIRAAVTTVLDGVVAVGYAASAWRVTMRRWLT